MLLNTHDQWQIKPLSEVAKIKGGKRVPKGEKLVFENTGYPYIRVADFTDDGTIDLSDIRYVTEDVFKQIKNYTINSEDLYISIAGTIGKAGIVPKELSGASLTENSCKLVFENIVFNRYVYYFTQTGYFIEQAGLNTRVAAMPKLALSRLGTIKLPFPPIPEQKRIVAILDRAFADIEQARAKTEQNLKNARELFESYLQQVFSHRGEGWVEYELIEIVDLKSGATAKKEFERDSGDIAYIKVSGMNLAGNEKEITTSDMYLNKVDIKNSNILPVGTTIFPKRGGAIATNKKRITSIPLCIDLNTMGIIPKTEFVLPYYIYFYFKTFDLLTISNGTTIPQINNYSFDGLKISVPNVECQKEEISKMREIESQVNKLNQIYKVKLNALETLKKSILQKAFSGELSKLKEGAAA
tara:strand:- start:12072 stop:13310 length:1239 start_codon:yes stop_codon:yes gene_type:complete